MNDKRDALLPDSPVEGLIPTLNNTGWMTVEMDDYSRSFCSYAGDADGEALDIGCAYGIATLDAIQRGARICACDIEQRHLDILEQRLDDQHRDRLRTLTGALPDVDFPDDSFAAILAARVLHFLDGTAIETTANKMYRWLQPGGRLFLVADSPYTGPWAGRAPDYEQRKQAGDPWPAFYDDYAAMLPQSVDPSEHPDFINPLDPDILRRVCEAAGFTVLSAEFLSSSTRHANGRDHAGVIAAKPE